MLDRLAALAAAALLSLTTLSLHETTTVGLREVTRSTLLGYDVAGRTGLDLAEAAQALAADALQQVEAAASAPVKLHADLLKPPHSVLGGRVSETWRAGAAAERRLAALRTSEIRDYIDVTRSKPRGLFVGRPTVEIRYPAGRRVPAIEMAVEVVS